MKQTFEYILQDGRERVELTVTRSSLRDAGWFDPGMTESSRWLLLRELAERQGETVGQE